MGISNQNSKERMSGARDQKQRATERNLGNLLRQTEGTHPILRSELQHPDDKQLQTLGDTYHVQMDKSTQSKKILRLGKIPTVHEKVSASSGHR